MGTCSNNVLFSNPWNLYRMLLIQMVTMLNLLKVLLEHVLDCCLTWALANPPPQRSSSVISHFLNGSINNTTYSLTIIKTCSWGRSNHLATKSLSPFSPRLTKFALFISVHSCNHETWSIHASFIMFWLYKKIIKYISCSKIWVLEEWKANFGPEDINCHLPLQAT